MPYHINHLLLFAYRISFGVVECVRKPNREDNSSDANLVGRMSTSASTNGNEVSPIEISSSQKSLVQMNRNKAQRIQLPVKPLSSYSAELIPISSGPPWKQYKQCLHLEMGGSIIVASAIPATRELYAVRTVSGPEAEEKLYMLRQLRHENLLTPHELFVANEQVFIVSELQAVSLDEFTIVSLDEIQLEAIIHQVC